MRVICLRILLALGLAMAIAGPVRAQSLTPPADDGGAIPLSEVAARAAEVRGLLGNLDAAITPSREAQAVVDRLPGMADELRARFDETRAQLGPTLPLGALGQVGATWESTRARLRGWSEILTQQTSRLEQERTRLASLRENWQRSRETAASGGAPKVALDEIDAILTGLNGARGRIETRLSTLLVAQYRLAELQRRCDEALARVAQAKSDRLRRLGERDGPPLWSPVLWAGAGGQARAAGRDVAAAARVAGAEVAQHHATRIPLHVLFFLLLVGLLWRGRRVARRLVADDPSVGSAAAVFRRPISSALVLACVAAPWIYPDATPAVLRVVTLVAIVPVVRLIRPSMDRSMAEALYAFGILFVVDGIRSVLVTAALFEHMVFLSEMLAASAVMLWMLVARRGLGPPMSDADAREAAALRYFGRLLLAAFLGAFGLGAVGYLELARLIGVGALGSTYYGLAIVAAVQVAKGLVSVLVRGRPLVLLESVRQGRATLERRAVRVLRWAGVVVWMVATLDALTLFDDVARLGLRALNASWGWGAIRVSLGDLVVFALTVWLSFMVAEALRLLLAEDVFPRVRLARGVPLALSAVVQYAVILAGFTLALAALGVDLTKLTILASAFGIGAGLGLQNLVNNFASGLILLFERPIHLGDVVEVTGLSGEVRHIGARATVVRTADGAEAFVPNSQLIAQVVTNWTYSDRSRRIVLPVRVAYGAVPERVTELLGSIASRHPQVMKQPAPTAVFLAFGENSLNFELRAWAERLGDAETIQGQLAAAVYAALGEAKIDLPVPRRDVRLWNHTAGEHPKE
jgi:potassium-dependent mechanosensitive channel